MRKFKELKLELEELKSFTETLEKKIKTQCDIMEGLLDFLKIVKEREDYLEPYSNICFYYQSGCDNGNDCYNCHFNFKRGIKTKYIFKKK